MYTLYVTYLSKTGTEIFESIPSPWIPRYGEEFAIKAKNGMTYRGLISDVAYYVDLRKEQQHVSIVLDNYWYEQEEKESMEAGFAAALAGGL